MGAPAVLALRCPRCGAELSGLQQDVVFWCQGCQVPHEVAGERFVERRGRVARAVLPSVHPVLHLPVWAFRVAYACHWEDPGRAALARLLPPIEWVYVTGFELHNASYFGDPGMIFTEKRVRIEAGPWARVAGCARGLEQAKAYVEPHLLRIIDRRVDVTGLDLSSSIQDIVLWGIPFHDEGHVLRDGILGMKFPAAAVDEMGGIRCLADV